MCRNAATLLAKTQVAAGLPVSSQVQSSQEPNFRVSDFSYPTRPPLNPTPQNPGLLYRPIQSQGLPLQSSQVKTGIPGLANHHSPVTGMGKTCCKSLL